MWLPRLLNEDNSSSQVLPIKALVVFHLLIGKSLTFKFFFVVVAFLSFSSFLLDKRLQKTQN